MDKKDSLPENESEPVQATTQTDKQGGEEQAGIAAPLSAVNSADAEDGEPNPAESDEETDRKQDEAISSLAEQTEWIARQTKWVKYQTIATSVLGAITLGVLIYHGWIMGRQSQAMKDQTAIMKGQLESMNSGSAQTQQMIAAMQKQADATTTQADTALAVAEQNKELVTHAGEQAKASLAQAEAAKQSVGAAQASARAAQLGAQVASESFYIGDRPYVFAGNMVIEKFDVGVKPRIGVVFTNSGKTPAIDFRFAGKASIGREPSPAKDSPSGVCCFEPTLKQLPTGSLTTLPAGEKVAAVIELEGELDKATIDDIKDGKRFLFVYGIASYKDGLGKPHDLKFCSLYLHSMEMFAPCTEFNSTN